MNARKWAAPKICLCGKCRAQRILERAKKRDARAGKKTRRTFRVIAGGRKIKRGALPSYLKLAFTPAGRWTVLYQPWVHEALGRGARR